MTSSSGHTYTYSYNNAGQQISLVDAGAGIIYVQDAHYAPPGMLTNAVHGGTLGITETNSYNNRLQPLMLSATGSQTVFSLSYSWILPGNKNNGTVYQIQNNRDSSRSVQFSYDYMNRLASAKTYNSSTWGDAYVYDYWGNLLQKNVTQGTGETLQLTVDTHNHISSFAYDASGNVTNDGVNTSLTYDAENRLYGTGGLYGLLYDGDDRRVFELQGFATTNYWYDEDSKLTSVVGAGSAIDYIYFNGKPIAFINTATLSANQYDYWSDHLGSINVVSLPSGSTLNPIQWEADYYPFGGERLIKNNLYNPLSFAAYYLSDLGYYHPEQRDMSSTIGRFLSPDPVSGSVGNPQSWNMYSYVLNNPTSLTDPSGLDPNVPGSVSFPYKPQLQGDMCGSIDRGSNVPCGLMGSLESVDTITYCNDGFCGAPLQRNPNTGDWQQQIGWQVVNGRDPSGEPTRTFVPIWGEAPDPSLMAANNADTPLNPYAQAVFSQPVLQTTAATMTNPCTYIGWTAAAAAGGAAGVGLAHAGEITTAAADNAPTLLTKVLNWWFNFTSKPGKPGLARAAMTTASAAGNAAISTCKKF